MPVAGPELGNAVRKMVEDSGITFHPLQKLAAADPATHTISFEGKESFAYDMLVAVPPHRSPRVVHMEHRGEDIMGFSQTKTAHHFLLTKNGGSIEVTAKDPKDAVSQKQIRMHLRHIATAFASGDFTDPMEVHDQTPPGVPTMKRLKTQIHYRFEETDTGGRVLIHSDNTKAIEAIHNFLRFQIREHHTGDSLKVK